MKILDIIQSNWFYYGIVSFMSIAIASIKLFSNFWYNFLAFVIFLSLEILVCSFWDIPIVAPIVLAVLVFMFFAIKDFRPTSKNNNSRAICLPVQSGIGASKLMFYYHYANFLVYGGAGSGKTKSIGKWLLQEYIRLGFAGFIYDFKDIDYTRTAYNLIKKYDYKGEFYYTIVR